MPEIHGNRSGVKDATLHEMEALYDIDIGRDEFAPEELLRPLAAYSARLAREIAVYISREGDILDVTIGSTDNVPLDEWRMRRSDARLSRVRCIHTHPMASCELSDVDMTALKSLRLDAMAAVGVAADGRITGVQAAFLGERVNGEPVPEALPVVSIRKLPQDAWMDKILESEKAVLHGEDKATSDMPERALIVGIESEKSLDELAALCESAGAVVIGRSFQKKTKPETATYIGSGKADELALDAQAMEADIVVVDDELTGVQQKNLEEIVRCKVVDRTTLILDIFAQRAKSSEGKLQVSLAQLKYQQGRLIGQGLVLSRLGGGIGTRGPGESKLEMDRRRIRAQVTDLTRQLEQLQKQRDLRRQERRKSETPTVALVGYTNTGKSTLLNLLSGAGVYVQDQLFATLDAVSRRVKMPGGGEFILTDTVGFIRKLPHDLVEAFKSTLEEAKLADALVIVSDLSSPDALRQREVVESVLEDLGATHQPRIDVFNKSDLTDNAQPLLPGAIALSAKTGEGVSELLSAIEKALKKDEREIEILVPFSSYALLNDLRAQGKILTEEHEDAGTRVTARLPLGAFKRLSGKYGDLIPAE